MKRIIKVMITGLLAFLLPLLPVFSQEMQGENEAPQQVEFVCEPYDPLISQLFAYDKELKIYAGINNVDNQIVIVKHVANGKGNDSLKIVGRYLVDVVKKRHDVHFIYRPKSVAIYDEYAVFLATHRDSCYLGVIDLNDAAYFQKHHFNGSAIAFSYNKAAEILYIVGENETGFDVIDLKINGDWRDISNVRDGIELHYQKPRMSEQIAKEDPSGMGMAIIAMSVVFLALVLLYLTFKQVGVQLIAMQARRAMKVKEAEMKPKPVPSQSIRAGDEVYAAIAAAIHLYSEELLDVEAAVLTINKVSRTYSPWSSKIHGLNTYFKR